MDGEFGVNRCKLLPLEWTGNGVLLYSTGNDIQSPGVYHDGKEYLKKKKKKPVHFVCPSLFAVQQEIDRTVKSTVIFKKIQLS